MNITSEEKILDKRSFEQTGSLDRCSHRHYHCPVSTIAETGIAMRTRTDGGVAKQGPVKPINSGVRMSCRFSIRRAGNYNRFGLRRLVTTG